MQSSNFYCACIRLPEQQKDKGRGKVSRQGGGGGGLPKAGAWGDDGVV